MVVNDFALRFVRLMLVGFLVASRPVRADDWPQWQFLMDHTVDDGAPADVKTQWDYRDKISGQERVLCREEHVADHVSLLTETNSRANCSGARWSSC